MLTVDLDRLGVAPGDRVLDMGCGGGRHAFALYRRGADVTALDLDAAELKDVAAMFAAMQEAGEVPAGASARTVRGSAYDLPFADGSFDAVIAAEVLEHLPQDSDAMRELFRVVKPGGAVAVTVPRWGPELVCWALSTRTTRSRAATSASTAARSWSAGSPPPGWCPRARRTCTGCTRRTGGSSAPSASTRASTRWSRRTTGCWSGTS